MKLPDDWKYIKLSDITTPLTEMAGDKKYETLSISAGIGFVNQAKKFGKELSGKQYEKYTVLQRGDFSYNKGNSKKYPQGCIYQVTDRDCAAVPNVFESFRFILGINDYYEQLFVSGFLNHQLASRINHGVRDDGLLNLTGKDFYDCFVPSPPLAEQKKIAEILYKQDKLILFKQKLLEQKQQQKKWLMQKLLEIPHTDADCEEKISLGGVVIDKSGWKKERFSDFSEIVSGGTPRTDKSSFWNGDIYWCTPTDITSSEKYISVTEKRITKKGLENSSAILLPKDSILMCSRATIWPRCINKVPMTTNQGFKSFIIKTNHAITEFVYYLIDICITDFKKLASGSTFIELSKSDLSNYEIYLPSLPEQKIIAKVLSAADKEIALIKSSIEQEKQKKKSLAQLLLTGTVRVKI